jgi:hypothetical protein
MRTVRISTPTVEKLKAAIAFLATRNEGPEFIPWETTEGFVDATPETIEQEHALYRELKAAGFSVSIRIPTDGIDHGERIVKLLRESKGPVQVVWAPHFKKPENPAEK